MYQSPPPVRTGRQRAKLVARIALFAVLAPWNCLLLYAGIGGNLVTMALGLPNHPFALKIGATLAVVALTCALGLALDRWLRTPWPAPDVLERQAEEPVRPHTTWEDDDALL